MQVVENLQLVKFSFSGKSLTKANREMITGCLDKTIHPTKWHPQFETEFPGYAGKLRVVADALERLKRTNGEVEFKVRDTVDRLLRNMKNTWNIN